MDRHDAAAASPSPYERRLLAAMVLLSLVIGAVSAWFTRNTMNPDGISYLDLSDKWMAGDLRGVVNGYWSPLYPALLAAVRLIARPGARSEFSAVHAANFMAFAAGLLTFSLFIVELLRRSSQDPSRREALILWGYGLFIWSSVSQISLFIATPDLIVSAFVWLLAFLVLRAGDGSPAYSVALGAVCGLAFLAKTIMFPIGIAVLCAGLPRRRMLRALVLSIVAFACVAGPWITSLSLQKGRPTFGDTGRLTYGLYVDGIQYYTHWHGDPPGSGIPVHATRRIFDRPTVYEFNGPLHATYPPWFDPSYWNEGMRTHVDVRGQLKASFETVKTYYVLFAKTQWAFAGLLILLLITGRRGKFDRASDAFRLGIPAAFALAIYGVIHVEGRYVGSFMALLFIAMLLAVDVDRRVLRSVSVVVAISLITASAVEVIKQYGGRTSVPLEWPIAGYLEARGLRDGDGVAGLGTMIVQTWPRLARVRVVAEVPQDSVEAFWKSGSETQQQVYSVLRRAGAKVLVGAMPGSCTAAQGWTRVPGTNTWYVFLDR